MSTGDAPTARHAVYWAPPVEHPLWRCGCEWLGRDPDPRAVTGAPTHPALSDAWRYGFHATLKAPLVLARGMTASQWLAAVRALAARFEPFPLPPLQVSGLGDFLALRPQLDLLATHPLRRLADACVLELDHFRAPATAAQRQRRLSLGLQLRQREHVERYGYAHVLDDWRFHLSLTGSLAGLDPLAIGALQAQAQRHFAAALRRPVACDALCAVIEPAPGAPLQLLERIALGAS